MSRKKRFNPVPATTEFRSMRPGDNRFYWLTVDGIENRCLGDVRNFNYLTEPAKVSANIKEGNQIYVKAPGVKHVTVWLGRGMVDFEKPLTVTLNQAGRIKDKYTPNLSTLLEDFCVRGDRNRLFLVKIPL
jgi:hypothetical protein